MEPIKTYLFPSRFEKFYVIVNNDNATPTVEPEGPKLGNSVYLY